MTSEIIGRKTEIAVLKKVLVSNEAEFVTIYGRRRIGKTYLIRQFFRNSPCLFFQVTGQKDGSLEEQLLNFTQAVSNTFFQGYKIDPVKNWREAFTSLTNLIRQRIEKEPVVIFLDELPWLVTPRSNFMQRLDYIWNTEWSDFKNLKLIVCGSAASWMLDNFIYTKGGLHNRITQRISLRPFNLQETKEYLKYRHIHLNNQQILELYMVMGGVPFYLKAVSKGLSAIQNINAICFNREGLLFDEFQKLYASLYKESEIHIELIRAVANPREGSSLDELLKSVKKVSSGGTLKKKLLELEASGFIQSLIPYGKVKKGIYYRILDEYTYFYLKWIEPFSNTLQALGEDSGFWEKFSNTPAWYSWMGYAFESICYKHVDKIRRALGLDKIVTKIGNWRYIPETSFDKGTQIDLLFDRADGIITLCEIKSSFGKFTIDKAYAEILRNKIAIYREKTKTTKQIFLAMITISGLTKNIYSEELISNEVVLNELF